MDAFLVDPNLSVCGLITHKTAEVDIAWGQLLCLPGAFVHHSEYLDASFLEFDTIFSKGECYLLAELRIVKNHIVAIRLGVKHFRAPCNWTSRNLKQYLARKSCIDRFSV